MKWFLGLLLLFSLSAEAVDAIPFSKMQVYDGSGTAITSTASGGHTYLDLNLSGVPVTSSQLPNPLVGGTAVNSSLGLQSTSGVGSSDFIRFLVGNNGATEAMRIITSGNVGIGTASPGSKLDVSGTANFSSTIAVASDVTLTNSINNVSLIKSINSSAGASARSDVRLNNGTSELRLVQFGTGYTASGIVRASGGYIDASGAGGLTLTSESAPIYFSVTGTTETMRLDTNGRLGIGATSPSTTLDVNGQVTVEGMTQTSAAQSGTVCYNSSSGLITYDASLGCLASSRRFKTNIKDLDSGLYKLMQMRPVSFYRKLKGKEARDPKMNGEHVGLIAEEVAAIDSRLIGTDDEGKPLGVRYQELTALLVKSIQELKKENDRLKIRLDAGGVP